MSDDDLYAVLRAADPLAGKQQRTNAATEESLHRLLAQGPSSDVPERRGNATRSTARRRLPAGRPRILAGASIGVAALGAVIAFAGASSPPAFAVTTAANGTVTITLNSLSAVDSLNAKLSAAGVHVRVAEVEPGCNAPVHIVGSSAPPATLQATPGAEASTIQLSSAPDPGASEQGLTNAQDGHTLVLSASPSGSQPSGQITQTAAPNVPDGDTLVLAASPSGLQPVGQITQTTAPSCVAPS
jgi:hypothetical protein